MTVLLVLATFLLFILIDTLSSRRKVVVPVASPVPDPGPVEPVWVAGYQLPEALHYHRGHTWVRALGDGTVLVGIDDFARRLLGRVAALKLPEAGAWLKQGTQGIGVDLGDREARLVSPVEGQVLAVNPKLLEKPSLVTDDPYGRGWLLHVRATDLASSLRNLFSGNLARRFMEEARVGLDLRLMALSGSVLQDGGEPVGDFAKHLSEEEWKRLTAEFLLG